MDYGSIYLFIYFLLTDIKSVPLVYQIVLLIVA